MSIKIKIKVGLLVFGVFILSSCSMIPMFFPPDLSNHELFKPYVGKTVYLRHEGYRLYRVTESHFDKEYEITSSTYDGYPLIAELEIGTPVYIEKVKKVRPGGLPDEVYYIGSIIIRGVNYEFEMGSTPYSDIYKYPTPFVLNKP